MDSDETLEFEESALDSGASTRFDFQHPVFRLSGCRFVIANDGKPAVVLPLGDLSGVVSISTLKNEFDFTGTADEDLLATVAASLKFVKSIYPGDSIPREILNGTASWSVQHRHLQIANGRLSLQLTSWLSGEETVVADREHLLRLTNSPEVKNRVNQAIGEIAGRLGLAHEHRQEVMSRVETAARELAYIEALRDRFGSIVKLDLKAQEFARAYRRDRGVSEDLQRIRVLIRKPVGDLSFAFDQVDAQCGEILALLKNLEAQIAFIRGARDDLHIEMMHWDEIIETWEDLPCTQTQEAEARIRDLYRFLAARYSVARSWKLSGQSHA